MIAEPVIQVVCCDLGGQVRGKGIPAQNKAKRLRRGVGWVPTNHLITCFNSIADGPFGSVGDLMLVPDEAAEVRVDWEDGAAADHFMLGDLVEMDGTPWSCCPRHQLRRALDDLHRQTGLHLRSAFEHEFWYSGQVQGRWTGFSLHHYRQYAGYAESLVAALRKAGLEPDTVIAEYGESQLEITVSPARDMRSADECLMVRELARSLAWRRGERVSFSPVIKPGVGNGLHLHFSLEEDDGTPAMHEPGAPLNLASQAGRFVAGIRHYLPAILAFTAPSAVSYERLQPHRWSAAFNNVAIQDREAGLRICPVVGLPGFDIAGQYHVEFRASDSTANPYLLLAALARAGLQGVKGEFPVPDATTGDLSLLQESQLEELGVQRLPTTLAESLEAAQAEPMVREWFGAMFMEVYLAHKRGELAFLADRDADEIRQLYASVF